MLQRSNSYRCRFCLASGRSREGGDSIQELFVKRQIITSDSQASELPSRNFLFAQTTGNPQLLRELPADCTPVSSTTRPFPLEKFILRKLEARRDQYFLT